MEGLELPGKSNYYIGNDPSRWHVGVNNYRGVWAESIYPGVSLHYYGNQSTLEYDFVVEPNANPNLITLEIEGAQKVRINNAGDLVLATAVGEIRQTKPLYLSGGRWSKKRDPRKVCN